MKPIFLIGYMGCGKTTLGSALAETMHVPFIDLDDLIEQRPDVLEYDFTPYRML